jgi:hypothetical protein
MSRITTIKWRALRTEAVKECHAYGMLPLSLEKFEVSDG